MILVHCTFRTVEVQFEHPRLNHVLLTVFSALIKSNILVFSYSPSRRKIQTYSMYLENAKREILTISYADVVYGINTQCRLLVQVGPN